MAKLLHKLNKVKWDAHRPFIPGSGAISEDVAEALNEHRNGDYETAISILQRKADWKSDPVSLRIFGHALLGLERFHESIEAHRTAQNLRAPGDPGKVEDEVNIASVYVGQKKYAEAMEALERALKQEPGYVPAILGQIAILNRQGRAADLKAFLINITQKQPSIWSNETVKQFLDDDTDMINVKQIISQISRLEE